MEGRGSFKKDVAINTENHTKHALRWIVHGLSFAMAFAASGTCLNTGAVVSEG
jgi:hypothetical protein